MADHAPIDLIPPTREVTRLLLGVTDGDLGAPTPCADWTVGALLAHVHGLARAFARAAVDRSGEPTAPPAQPSAADLPQHWRSGLPARLEALATAWQDPAAWQGGTRVGGVSLPAAVAGVFGAVELVVHGWDLARATDQEFAADPRMLAVLAAFLSDLRGGGGDVPYGPVVPTLDEATLLDEVVALTGRDPRWRPGRRVSAPSASAAG